MSDGGGMVIRFVLPWPPSGLSPNRRQHWAALARAKRSYRQVCVAAVLEQRVDRPPAGVRFHLELRFVPPDARSYDRDNLVARMKSGLDGAASALGINDSAFARVTAEVGPVRRGVGGVDVTLIEIAPVGRAEGP